MPYYHPYYHQQEARLRQRARQERADQERALKAAKATPPEELVERRRRPGPLTRLAHWLAHLLRPGRAASRSPRDTPRQQPTS